MKLAKLRADFLPVRSDLVVKADFSQETFTVRADLRPEKDLFRPGKGDIRF